MQLFLAILGQATLSYHLDNSHTLLMGLCSCCAFVVYSQHSRQRDAIETEGGHNPPLLGTIQQLHLVQTESSIFRMVGSWRP